VVDEESIISKDILDLGRLDIDLAGVIRGSVFLHPSP